VQHQVDLLDTVVFVRPLGGKRPKSLLLRLRKQGHPRILHEDGMRASQRNRLLVDLRECKAEVAAVRLTCLWLREKANVYQIEQARSKAAYTISEFRFWSLDRDKL
jgi:hypothetical protein